MASFHDLFKALSPISYSDVPQDDEGRKAYLKDHLSEARLLVESVPQPTISAPSPASRSRAVSSASSSAEISASAARVSAPVEPESWQEKWGKPIKFSTKDNPLEISLYKLSSKDGRGAWFARRSVHDGLSYDKWKKGLEEEFEQSLHVEGGPGAGKVRGLGAEKRAASHKIAGVGNMDVWHVSAQFPGPSAPRDFVSLVMTSDAAVEGEEHPNHFMVISKPCEHEECPPQDGLVRGSYESVEFIREISPKQPATSIKSRTSFSDDSKGDREVNEPQSISGKDQNKSVTFAESQHENTKEDGKLDAQEILNPVEWIMITRSDPGGSIPRWIVEKGTPGGIVSDASKFLDWACKIDVGPGKETSKLDSDSLESSEKASTEATTQAKDTTSQADPDSKDEEQTTTSGQPSLPEELPLPPSTLSRTTSHASKSSSRSISSASFASAESDLAIPPPPSTQGKQALNAQEKALVQLANRKAQLNDTLQRAHETAFKDTSQPTEKETRAWSKTQAKHDREVAKAEARYADTLRSIETQRVKDEEKARRQREREEQRAAEKARKEDKNRSEKSENERWNAERQTLRDELDTCKTELKKVRSERDSLREKMRGLQGVNIRLSTLVAKMDGGERLLGELGIRDATP